MPRYEIRRTSNSALTYVEGDLPLELMLSQAAGTYRARVMSEEWATDIVVPTLTASITQSSLVVGETATLTTNAPAGATFQWRLDGTNISGATSASYVTAAAGSLTCVVTAGPQSVPTAGVTVSAASALSIVDAQSAYSTTVQNPTFTRDLSSLAAGDRLLLFYTQNENSTNPTSVTVGGVSVGASVAKFGTQAARTIWIYQYVMPAAGSASTAISVTNSVTPNGHWLTLFGIRGGAFGAAVGAADTNNTVFSAAITPPATPNLLLAVHHHVIEPGSQSWTNATGITVSNTRARAASVTDATAGAARTITSTLNAGSNGILAIARIDPL